MRILLTFVVALLLVGTLRAEDARTNPVLRTIPEKEAAAVSEKWGIRSLTERLQRSGDAGCADAFWELLTLCENKPEARTDAQVQTVVSWIVLDSRMLSYEILNDPVLIQLPKVLPDVGRKVFEKRIVEWLSRGDAISIQDAPFTWPQYGKIDRCVLLAALRARNEAAPAHNPTIKIWLAGALLSAGDPDGQRLFAEARSGLLKRFESSGEQQLMRIVQGMALNGVKEALPMLAELGRKMPVANTHQNTFSAMNVLSVIKQALNWQLTGMEEPQQLSAGAVEEQFKPVVEWLNKNLPQLKWDPITRKYSSEAPPPGLEKLYAVGRQVAAKYNVDVRDWLAQGGHSALPTRVVNWLEANKAAATDPLAAELMSEVLALPRYRDWLLSSPLSSKLGALPTTAEAFTERVLKKVIQNRLEMLGADFDGMQSLLNDGQRETVEKALRALIPEFTQDMQQALKEKKSEDALLALMRVMVCGGSAPRETAVEIFCGAPEAWRMSNGQLYRWWNALLNMKRKNCMLFLLQWGAADLKRPEKAEGRFQPVEHFITYMSWNRGEDVPEVSPEKLLAILEEWYARNEASLTFDKRRSGFESVPSPRRQELLNALQPMVEKYKISITHLQTPPKRGNYLTENAGLTWEELASLPNAVPDILKDPEYRLAVEAMALLYAVTDNYPRKMMPILSQVESPLAKELIHSTLQKAVAHARTAKHIHMMSNAARNLQELHPPLIRTIQNEIAKELREGPEPKSAVERLQVTYILAALNQSSPADELKKRFGDAGTMGFDQLNSSESLQLIARSGNVNVHRLFVVAARELPERRGALLRQLEVQALGMPQRGFVTPEQDEMLLKRYEAWLDADESKIVWNTQLRRYEGPKPNADVEQFVPPPAAGSKEQGKAVRPPAPPPPEF